MSIPESFWTDDAPIGEVPPGVVPMSANDVIHRAIERIGQDIWSDERLILEAARELYTLSTAGIEFGSDIWLDVQGRMFDAVQRRYPSVAPVSLVENAHAEAVRRGGVL